MPRKHTPILPRLLLTLAGVVVVVVAVAAAGGVVGRALPPPLPEAFGAAAVPKVNVEAQVVAGLSAGAFFAVQYHVAFSADLIGAGILAGGPFYCAQGEETTAELNCMSQPELLDVSKCVEAAKACASGSVCDPVAGLGRQRVWLYSGTADTVVNPGVMAKAQQFYQTFVPAAQVNATFGVPSEHAWVTSNFGNSCGTLGSPYINNCGFDASMAMLSHVTGRALATPVAANQSAFFAVDQGAHTPGGEDPAKLSLGPTAYAYVPGACAAGAPCTLVIALHGCQQTLADVGADFVRHVGLNEVAEANNMVVLYPQAIKSLLAPSNPEGCFDWWGYTNADYANQKGPQMATVRAMAQAIASGTARARAAPSS